MRSTCRQRDLLEAEQQGLLNSVRSWNPYVYRVTILPQEAVVVTDRVDALQRRHSFSVNSSRDYWDQQRPAAGIVII